MSVLRALFGESRESIWRQLADGVGGQFIEGGLFSTDVVQVTTGDWIVTLDVVPGSDKSPPYTRMRAPYVNPEGLRFTIYRAGSFSGLGKAMGMQDIEVGYPYFDENFIIKANSEPRVRSFLANERVRELIHAQPRIRLDVQDDEGWFGPAFPEGVDELRFLVAGVIKDLRLLESLFDLFAESLNQLCHDGKAYEDDVDIHIRRLRGPGHDIRQRKLTLWEGNRPRREAAEALGRLKSPKAIGPLVRVLDDGSGALRARAIAALGQIGSERAVPALVTQLGDGTKIGGKALGEWAAEALHALGEGAVADAVRAALSGDPSRLGDAVGRYRLEVLEALATALTEPALGEPTGVHAASALRELDAIEALPRLREALRILGERSLTGHAVAEAVRQLEGRAALPRPAAAPPESAETLPRSAGAPASETETLPRPSERRSES